MMADNTKRYIPYDKMLILCPPIGFIKAFKCLLVNNMTAKYLFLLTWITCYWLFIAITQVSDILFGFLFASLSLAFLILISIGFIERRDIDNFTLFQKLLVSIEIIIVIIIFGVEPINYLLKHYPISLLPSAFMVSERASFVIHTIFIFSWCMFFFIDKYRVFSCLNSTETEPHGELYLIEGTFTRKNLWRGIGVFTFVLLYAILI